MALHPSSLPLVDKLTEPEQYAVQDVEQLVFVHGFDHTSLGAAPHPFGLSLSKPARRTPSVRADLVEAGAPHTHRSG
ncbi:MAG: hypothetical protein Q8N13_09075 [Acidovorax sp.]|nr:hypothetical protein [Acidovorax sp.]